MPYLTRRRLDLLLDQALTSGYNAGHGDATTQVRNETQAEIDGLKATLRHQDEEFNAALDKLAAQHLVNADLRQQVAEASERLAAMLAELGLDPAHALEETGEVTA